MADMTAPTELNDEQSDRIRNHPRIKRRAEKCQRLKEEIKKRNYRFLKDVKDTGIYEKKKADDKLNRERIRLREKLKKRVRKRHFRNGDTTVLNQQFGDHSPPRSQKQTPGLTPPVYQIRERAALVQLICRSKAELTTDEEHARRLECIRLWIRWQDRQETRGNRRVKYLVLAGLSKLAPINSTENGRLNSSAGWSCRPCSNPTSNSGMDLANGTRSK
jgi:hypothetical protein